MFVLMLIITCAAFVYLAKNAEVANEVMRSLRHALFNDFILAVAFVIVVWCAIRLFTT